MTVGLPVNTFSFKPLPACYRGENPQNLFQCQASDRNNKFAYLGCVQYVKDWNMLYTLDLGKLASAWINNLFRVQLLF